ncbi:MAG: S-methyl-5'-thioinosine phosphorylase [Gammaproteobacteria bacterium]|nr:S-methyl-5'-thioinosine phosphorylase [Gammaproteobacteria bacterium]
MKRIGIIGGSALEKISGLKNRREDLFETHYGIPSAPLIIGELNGVELVFLNRHGQEHNIPPHLINYQANVAALKMLEVDVVIGVASVGGITSSMMPGAIVVPDQLIDYSYGRDHSLYYRDFTMDKHIEFTEPYAGSARKLLLDACKSVGVTVVDGGVYGVTQGPRLETAAEIRRLERDGCDLVGMTGMPEAGLAREMGLPYACLALVVNWAAGKMQGNILDQAHEYIAKVQTDALAIVQVLPTVLKTV